MEHEVIESNETKVEDTNLNTTVVETKAELQMNQQVEPAYLQAPSTYGLSDIWSQIERTKAMLEDLIAAGKTNISRDIFEHFDNITNDLESEMEKTCVLAEREEVVVDEQTNERVTLDNSFIYDANEQIIEQDLEDRVILKNYESDSETDSLLDLDVGQESANLVVENSEVQTSNLSASRANTKQNLKSKQGSKKHSKPKVESQSAAQVSPNDRDNNKTFRVAFINIEWTNDKGVDKGGVRSAAGSLVQTVNILSRSQFPIKAEVFSKKVRYAHSKKNLNRAEDSVINQVGNFDRYVIFNNKLGGPHSGAKIAHLPGSLKTTVYHEFFHAWLGHAGIVEYLGDGKTRVDHTGDGTSFMSRFASNSITSVQFIDMKWLKTTEIADRNLNDPPQTYVLKKLRPSSSQDNFEGQRVVRVRRDGAGKDLFVSYLGKGIKNKGKRNEQRVDQIAVHYGLGGGSQRLGLFPTQKIIEDLIVVTKVEEGSDSQVKLIVGPAPALRM